MLEVPNGIGGMSGGGMSEEAEQQTSWLVNARNQVNGQFDIVGSNGVLNGRTMKKRLNLGVSAVSATTVFWEAPSWKKGADDLLQSYAAELE